ncbi:hypothetical protein CALCODRAFT_518049 [Calocera cornea HHB12733]|uniref:Chitin synthase export chaperone n=1 Tax=Calocera cornea HHB12733 TaxID=1353952 RepID=A0A165FE46_9BASI|nr:hypothetical protein CALCODRAFT_518049 [Calocera cornea HHB12733]
MASVSFTNFPTISGGLPTRPDLAPSIVFVVAYFILLFPTLWRTYTYRRPRMLLFTYVRLVAFIFIRIATFALRADEAVTASIPFDPVPSIGIFIGEQILLGVGFIIMVDMMVSLLLTLMHLSLVAAIALGITAGALYSSALSNPSRASLVRSLRIASTVIALVVMALLVLICLFLLIGYPHLGVARTTYLFVTSGLLLIIPAYRLSTSLTAHPSVLDLISTATRVKFYILQVLMEYALVMLLDLVDVRVWFFACGREAQMMLDGSHPHECGAQGNGNTKAGEKPGNPELGTHAV